MARSKCRSFTVIALFALCLGLPSVTQSQEPGWTGHVLKLRIEKEISDATPILLRPYRPLHVYGNTVRRYYYRGNPLPLPHDLTDAVYAFFYFR
jgi:hypothetical protein